MPKRKIKQVRQPEEFLLRKPTQRIHSRKAATPEGNGFKVVVLNNGIVTRSPLEGGISYATPRDRYLAQLARRVS